MDISTKKIKGIKVYFENQFPPAGTISDIIFDVDSKRILGFELKTLSLIPIPKIVDFTSVKALSDKHLILYENTKFLSYNYFFKTVSSAGIKASHIKKLFDPQKGKKTVKDMHFDFEMGELSDIVILENILTGQRRININKIYLKDNTIYINR